MNYRQQIEVFVEGVTHYFDHLNTANDIDGANLRVGAPYLMKTSQDIGLDHTGIIDVSGSSRGGVYFSASRSLLRYILLGHGEREFGDHYMSDVVGEVANTIAGNARRHFGADFYIAPPKVKKGRLNISAIGMSEHCFVLPLRWRNNAAELIVNLEY